MAPITRQDLDAFGADLKEYIRERDTDADRRNVERFAGINDRLDKVNGNIARHEREIGAAAEARAAQAQKIVNLEREVFRRGQRSDLDAFDSNQRVATLEGARDDARPAITRGGVKRAMALLAGAGAIVEGLHRVGPYVLTLLARVK